LNQAVEPRTKKKKEEEEHGKEMLNFAYKVTVSYLLGSLTHCKAMTWDL
jgi:hypothetical protein